MKSHTIETLLSVDAYSLVLLLRAPYKSPCSLPRRSLHPELIAAVHMLWARGLVEINDVEQTYRCTSEGELVRLAFLSVAPASSRA